MIKRWKGVGVLVLGILIILLAAYLANSVYRNSAPSPSWVAAMVPVGIVMGLAGFLTGLEPVPPGGESVGFGNCTICGKTNQGVATRSGVNYCNLCYNNGAAQAYFDGMDRQSRESERARPQIEERLVTQPPPPQVAKEIIKEREVIHRETIVKIRCGHCHRLFEEEKGSCPYCGAPV